MPLFTTTNKTLPKELTDREPSTPPFSILNTTTPEWLHRRTLWSTLIPDSTAGRDVKRYNATPTNVFSSHETSTKKPSSVSMFDPCLAEILIRWFSRRHDRLLDPFAGGSVRGVVASVLSREYTGLDLSASQVTENEAQYKWLHDEYSGCPGTAEWLVGDSDTLLDSVCDTYNMVLTCPPYYDLEQYSHDPRDLSRLPTYENFLAKYGSILQKSSQHLEDNSFFVIVVSEFRADQYDLHNSQYRGFVPDTIHIMRDLCGLKYYNEIILENSIGSLPIRAPRSFAKTRKIGRRHQNVLVFYKGDIGQIERKFSAESC